MQIKPKQWKNIFYVNCECKFDSTTCNSNQKME